MTGNDLIALAGHLIVNRAFGNAEARYRSAVSRAYYGAYLLAVEFLSEFDVSIAENHTGHEQAYRALFQTDQSEAQAAARLLNDLRSARNEADYRLRNRRLAHEANARLDVEMAGDFLATLTRCRTEPTRSEIQARLDSRNGPA